MSGNFAGKCGKSLDIATTTTKNVAVWRKTVSIFDASVEHVRAHFNEVCLCIRAYTCRCDTLYVCVGKER